MYKLEPMVNGLLSVAYLFLVKITSIVIVKDIPSLRWAKGDPDPMYFEKHCHLHKINHK